MSSRGWEGVTQSDLARIRSRFAPAAPVSKFRNQRVEVDGIRFDSKREAAAWMRLRAREHAGEIKNLRRQVPYSLMCPIGDPNDGMSVEVAKYLADFVFTDCATGHEHIQDAKGVKTQVYVLKKRWLELQAGIVIEEV